jgi:hypothetical protein
MSALEVAKVTRGSSRVLVIAVATLLAACATGVSVSPSVGSGPTPSAAAPSGSALTQDAAIEVARGNVPPAAQFVSAQFGQRSSISIPAGPVSGPVESPDELVWVIAFTETFSDICNPFGTCLSPRPGYSYVVIDGGSGRWVTTYGYSAAP